MWVPRIIGVVLVVLGGVWIAQGVGALHGSMMSGHPGYAALGAVTVLAGLVLLVLGWIRRPRG
ncbi:hypothetical protein SAMN05414137_107271 [Streptacidiphilus jiangxiensis]|uniref:Uncharacterized protein n=1 Tax=Streptacidiphilus jiangxiensis TaxID=235985 RepID=A0A1H7P9S1_STRJI|nr:hypothetical protein [Streptacidiphilus jiangxiensis]SEL32178.1 hypothetical protein SAMN05414137_107271 [Streptacidiphilus jiangxiensis]